jgi:hypothetical protein
MDSASHSPRISGFSVQQSGQTPDQQLKDESECYGAAKQQSGIDPKAPSQLLASRKSDPCR